MFIFWCSLGGAGFMGSFLCGREWGSIWGSLKEGGGLIV